MAEAAEAAASPAPTAAWDWRAEMERRLASYATYEKDWRTEGYGSCGAIPFAPKTLANARTVLCDLVEHFPETAIHSTPVPGMNGVISLEWDWERDGGRSDIGIEIKGDSCFVWDSIDLEQDLNLPADMPELRDLFARACKAHQAHQTHREATPVVGEVAEGTEVSV